MQGEDVRTRVMNALLLAHGLGIGGAEMMIAHLARYLRACGDQVEIGCLGALGAIGEELRSDGLRVVVHARRPGFDASLAWRLARYVRAHDIDIVHAHQRTALFYGLLAGLGHGAPMVYTEHGPPVPVPLRRQRAFNRAFAWRLRGITAVSRHTARMLATHEGFSGRDIEIVPNGIEVERFSAASDARAAARAALGLPPDAVMVGSIGRLEAVKNHRLLVHVLARLRQDCGDVRLLLVGGGPERAALEAAARQAGVGAAVSFLGERRDIGRVLPAFDVFCLPSLQEGVPLALLEAMAARVPVVAAAVGGIPEVLCSEREGLLVESPSCNGREAGAPLDPDYVERFARAVERLLRDPVLRQNLTVAAAVRVRACTAAAVCRRYREILTAAAGCRAAGAVPIRG